MIFLQAVVFVRILLMISCAIIKHIRDNNRYGDDN